MKLKDFIKTLDGIHTIKLLKDGEEICITYSDSILIPMFEDAEILSIGLGIKTDFVIELGEKTP